METTSLLPKKALRLPCTPPIPESHYNKLSNFFKKLIALVSMSIKEMNLFNYIRSCERNMIQFCI